MPQKTIDLCTYAILLGTATSCFLMPVSILSTPLIATASAAPTSPPESVRLTGLVRDFRESHPDFKVAPEAGPGHYAGMVAPTLGDGQRPSYRGAGGESIDSITTDDGVVTATEPYSAMVTVLGAAIQASGVDVPVTASVEINGERLDPFGDMDLAYSSNLNDGKQHVHVFGQVFDPEVPIIIHAQSFLPKTGGDPNSDTGYRKLYGVVSVGDKCVKVLRNGDPVPDITGFESQAAVVDFIEDFIDLDSGRIVLLENQAIYLLELGTKNLNSPAADFQDLVLLVTLGSGPEYLRTLDQFGHETEVSEYAAAFRVDSPWRDIDGNQIAPHLALTNGDTDAGGNERYDVPGTAGVVDSGAVESAESFKHWFTNVLGTNVSARHSIELTRNGNAYEFNSDAFFPADGKLFGNEGKPHNYCFTFALELTFEYHVDEGQFIEAQGGDGLWIFVDDKLAIDLGGYGSNAEQRIDLDRLGLTDRGEYTVRMFYAQRRAGNPSLNLRTNVVPGSTRSLANVTAIFD